MRTNRRRLLQSTGALSLAALISGARDVRLIGAQGSAEYDLVDLGSFVEVVEDLASPPEFGSFNVINSRGEVAGSIGISDVRVSPALWSADGKRRKLKSGKYGAVIHGLNDDGLAVGAERTSEHVQGFFQSRPVVWRDGEMELLLGPDGAEPENGSAYEVNNDGLIGGQATLSDGTLYVVRWIDGQVESLPTDLFEGQYSGSNLFAMNSAGDILGYAYAFGETFETYNFIWSGDEVTLLPPFEVEGEEIDFSPVDINAAGQVLVAYSSPFFSSALLTDGVYEVVTSPDPEQGFVGSALNDAGVIVGASRGRNFSRACRVVDGEAVNLNTLIPEGSGVVLTGAMDINDEGMILAEGYATEDDSEHGYVLVPSP